jgi:GGDEF domain-containing protein
LWGDGVSGCRLEVSATIFRDEDGRPLRLVGLARNITERKTAEAHIEYLAQNNGLTGLPNRALITDFMTQAMAQADRTGYGLAVFFIDLDHFKTINDSLGHAVGDKQLEQV